MLRSLYAKNFALIHELRVNFGDGLNIITGETGAGKSILIGALGGILGEKLKKDIIRSGQEKCILEAEFQLDYPDEIDLLFQENDIEVGDNYIIIRREINSSGKSRCFINDSPVPLSILVDLGNLLVDLHGQHQHQLLLQTRRHIDYLDNFGQFFELKEKVKNNFEDLLSVQKELKELVAKEQTIIQTRDLLEFQLREVDKISPQINEDEGLENEEKILKNSELLFDQCSLLLKDLYEKDGSVSEVLRKSEQSFSTLGEIDTKFNSYKKECQESRLILDEVINSLREYTEGISFDPARLENIRLRLAELNGLKKKYGGTIDAILEFQNKARQELDLIENLNNKIEDSQNDIEMKRTQLYNYALELSEKRNQNGLKINDLVSAELAQLGMPHSQFKIEKTKIKAVKEPFVKDGAEEIKVSASGIDKIEFLITTNSGEDLKPLAAIASGGEISRIMLALKTLLAHVDTVPVLVFDEIDIGISGRIAQAVGRKLRTLGTSFQVICITHLPQIASLAQHHFLVEKFTDGTETKTNIRKLENRERTEQIAQLFGGEKVTEAHLLSASELIKESEDLAF
jgi:DNA repair protein RecN (Recombination protein N)